MASGTGIDLNERSLSQPGGFTQDLTNWHNNLNEYAPDVMKTPGFFGGDGESTMGLGDIASLPAMFLPGNPQAMKFGDQYSGGSDIHFGDSDQTGYAGRMGSLQKGEDPAFLGFFNAHDARDKIHSGALGSTNVEDHSFVDKTALKYPPTMEGYQDYLEDKENPHHKEKENPTGAMGHIMQWTGMDPLTTAQGMPTEARQRYRTRVFDAFMKRRVPQRAREPVMNSDNPILKKVFENLPGGFGYEGGGVQRGDIR